MFARNLSTILNVGSAIVSTEMLHNISTGLITCLPLGILLLITRDLIRQKEQRVDFVCLLANLHFICSLNFSNTLKDLKRLSTFTISSSSVSKNFNLAPPLSLRHSLLGKWTLSGSKHTSGWSGSVFDSFSSIHVDVENWNIKYRIETQNQSKIPWGKQSLEQLNMDVVFVKWERNIGLN